MSKYRVKSNNYYKNNIVEFHETYKDFQFEYQPVIHDIEGMITIFDGAVCKVIEKDGLYILTYINSNPEYSNYMEYSDARFLPITLYDDENDPDFLLALACEI